MRILTYLHSFEPGGVERIALRLVRDWRGRGIDAPLIMGRERGAMGGDVGYGLSYAAPRPWPGIARWESLWMVVTLLRAIPRVAPDVIFCPGNAYTVVAVLMKLMLGRRCPPIVAKISNDLDRPHAHPFRRWWYRRWQWLQGRLIDHFVAMTSAARDEVASAMNLPPARLSVIANPTLSQALLARIAALPRPPRRPGRRFVAAGRLAPQKNLPLMLRAFARGARPDDTLTIYGQGLERERLDRLVLGLGLDGRVRFRGYTADPAATLTAFDCLLLSSDYEGVPAVVLEALAAGLNVVATDCSRSMTLLLADGALGTMVTVGDEAGFAAAIAKAARGSPDPAAALAMARRFTMEASGADYLTVFAAVVARHRLRRSAIRTREVPADALAALPSGAR